MNPLQKIAAVFKQQGHLASLIIISAAVFLTVNVSLHILRIDLVPFLGLPIGGAEFLYKFWTLFTYMFTHESLGHVFFNMVLFYFSGQLFFLILGESRLTYVYVMSGLAGASLLIFCGLIWPQSFSGSILIGASAAVMGVVMVMAIYAPNFNVSLWGIINMPYKYFALLTFLLSTIIDFSLNTGGKISHIGGAMFGLAYGYFLKKGTDLFSFSFLKKRSGHLKVVSRAMTQDDHYNVQKVAGEQRLNALLDKISKSGYDSLTKKEKDELFNLSKKS